MTSFARIYNLHLHLYDVIIDLTDRLKKSDISYVSNNSVEG